MPDHVEPRQPATLALRDELGGPLFDGWVGLFPGDDATATLAVPGEATFRFPDGPRGWHKCGLRLAHDGSRDWRDWCGLQFEVRLDGDGPLRLEVSVSSAQPETGTATVALWGAGWHSVSLPWSAFAFEQARTAFLTFVKVVRIAAAGEQPGPVALRNLCALRGERVALVSAVRGKAAPAGASATYEVLVGNCTPQAQLVTMRVERHGWEAMAATVEPAELLLGPDESQVVTLNVQIPGHVPPGGHEGQLLRAIPNGDGGRAATMAFTTASELPHPFILHTPERWDEVRAKVRDYPWARELKDEVVAQAEAWVVPEIAQPPHNDPDDTYGPFLFATSHENALMACGIAWQLTGERPYAEKVALFLRRLADPERGYPRTFRACSQHLVQEGHFFQHVAMAYDMVLDASVLSAADRDQIHHTFKLLIETMDQANRGGAINNWNLAELVGACYCALAMQDLVTAERFLAGPAGILDQLAKGTMDDGWWYECAISYNLWCAAELCQVALAYEPFGVNLRDMYVSAAYGLDVSLSAPDGRVELSGGKTDALDLNGLRRPFGMSKAIWGPRARPYRTIRDLWDGLLPFVDYRGVMFGVNDSTERQVTGYRTEVAAQPFELAYSLYRDPAYAAIVKHGAKRDLLYGVPELPAETPELHRHSAYADNVGVVMLRSQTPGRPMREQIQAVLHYGTHGWAHGHFDRTGLLALMRYGRSCYNPEAVWYSYEPFMYKFYVQTSVSQNMVVVDQKLQEATPGERLLFHSGELMQATVVQTEARWSNPPYGGMVYDYVPVNSFAEKCWREGRHVPIPEEPPAYGSLTGYSEPILQRRLMVVTDDYVVLADYVRGGEPHTFECLFQLKGFEGLEAAERRHLRHDAQWSEDPLSSAQFVTDCDWYAVTAPARASFTMRWGEGADNAGTLAPCSEDGTLRLDVHTLWPPRQELMLGTAPEYFDVQKRLFYAVRGDGATLAEGRFGAWILGKAELDVPVEGLAALELETTIELTRSEFVHPAAQRFRTEPTLFWANARLVTRDGRAIPLSALRPQLVGIRAPEQPGRDYFGGPLKIVGEVYAEATPGEPQEPGRPGLVRVDLRGLDAVRFKAVLGGDYPLGDEAQRRKTYAVRTQGSEARFLTIVEPFEERRAIRRAEARDASRLRVELADGRVQELTIGKLDGDGQEIAVTLVERTNETVLRTETARAGATVRRARTPGDEDV